MTTLVFFFTALFNFNLDQGLNDKQFDRLTIHQEIIIIETVDIRNQEEDD